MSADLSIYLVTDKSEAAAAGHDLSDLVAAAVAGGVTAVQVREKTADAGEFLDTVLKVAAVLSEPVALFVNDRVDVFLAARRTGARVTGVHVAASKADAAPALGVEGFAALAGATFLPAVAIGGVTAADLPGLRAGGAAGVAVISAICGAADPRAATARLGPGRGGAAGCPPPPAPSSP